MHYVELVLKPMCSLIEEKRNGLVVNASDLIVAFLCHL